MVKTITRRSSRKIKGRKKLPGRRKKTVAEGRSVDLKHIPSALKKRPQWVVWKFVERAGQSKPTKMPYDPETGSPAKPTDPDTWRTFEAACKACRNGRYDGIGFVFSADDEYAGIDLDNCLDPKSGKIEPWAREIIDRIASYTEVSPSGTGVKIFIRGTLPGRRRRKRNIEI